MSSSAKQGEFPNANPRGSLEVTGMSAAEKSQGGRGVGNLDEQLGLGWPWWGAPLSNNNHETTLSGGWCVYL